MARRRRGTWGWPPPPWKSRYGNHKTDFKYSSKRRHTRLAGYVWQLKDEGVDHTIKWQFLARASTYKSSTKTCRLCLTEKFNIMHSRGDMASLNKRKEFFSSCLHKEKLLL